MSIKKMAKNKSHVSLKDLALEIGVSNSTVSRALNNHPDISPEVTKKIQKLAIEWNYTPNPLAMGLLKESLIKRQIPECLENSRGDPTMKSPFGYF